MELYCAANTVNLFKAISYVLWLHVLLHLANFVIEDFILWNM